MNSDKQRPKLWKLFHLRFLVSCVLMNRCIFLFLSSHFCVNGYYYNRVKRLSYTTSRNCLMWPSPTIFFSPWLPVMLLQSSASLQAQTHVLARISIPLLGSFYAALQSCPFWAYSLVLRAKSSLGRKANLSGGSLRSFFVHLKMEENNIKLKDVSIHFPQPLNSANTLTSPGGDQMFVPLLCEDLTNLTSHK